MSHFKLEARAHKDTDYYFLETYAFSLYDNEIFKGKIIRHESDPSEFLEEEMKLNAEVLVHEIINEIFEKEGDKNIFQNLSMQEIEENTFLSIRLKNHHNDSLTSIRNDTRCNTLKEHLTKVLSIPTITVTDYQK